MAKGKSSNAKDAVANELGKVLANTYALALKTQNYHWNVEGPHFYALHKLFEEQYTALHAAVDEIAERMRALGATAPGGFGVYGQMASIKDAPAQPKKAQDMIADLAAGHTAAAACAKAALEAAESVGDDVSVDLMVERITAHDKDAWMLNSMLA